MTFLARERYEEQPMWWPSLSSYISLYYRRYVPNVSNFLILSRSQFLFFKVYQTHSLTVIFKRITVLLGILIINELLACIKS